MAGTGETAPAVKEARLASAATSGDPKAFAALCERYEQSAFNLAYRISGSEIDAADAVQAAVLNVAHGLPRLAERQEAFGTALFAATRAATYDLMRRRHHHPPRDAVTHDSPPDDALAAGMRLPDRQREVLALRELHSLSYGEIAAIVESTPEAVAQLIARARINLQDELQGTVLATAAAPPDCERALPLIAARQDGQLDAASDDAAWLDAHLTECERCGLAVRTMEEAVDSYQAWLPIAAPPWLFQETMGKATGAIAAARADRGPDAGGVNGSRNPGQAAAGDEGGSRRRRAAVAAGLGALLLTAAGAAALVGHHPRQTGEPAATTTPAKHRSPHRGAASSGKTRRAGQTRAKGKSSPSGGETVTVTTAATPVIATAAPSEGGARGSKPSGPTPHSGGVTVKPTRQASSPKAATQPATTPASTTPAPVAAPVATTPTTVETAAVEESGKHEPHGKAVGRPPK